MKKRQLHLKDRRASCPSGPSSWNRHRPSTEKDPHAFVRLNFTKFRNRRPSYKSGHHIHPQARLPRGHGRVRCFWIRKTPSFLSERYCANVVGLPPARWVPFLLFFSLMTFGAGVLLRLPGPPPRFFLSCLAPKRRPCAASPSGRSTRSSTLRSRRRRAPSPIPSSHAGGFGGGALLPDVRETAASLQYVLAVVRVSSSAICRFVAACWCCEGWACCDLCWPRRGSFVVLRGTRMAPFRYDTLASKLALPLTRLRHNRLETLPALKSEAERRRPRAGRLRPPRAFGGRVL